MKQILRMAMAAATAFGMGAMARAEGQPLAITYKDSDQVLTVGGSAEKNEEAVILSPLQLQLGQGFRLKPIKNPKDWLFDMNSQQSDKHVNSKDEIRKEIAPIAQRSCNDTSCQVLHMSDKGTDGYREFRNKLSGKCLAATEAAPNPALLSSRRTTHHRTISDSASAPRM